MIRDIEFKCVYDNHIHRINDIDFKHKMINLFGADTINFEDGILIQNTGFKAINGDIYEGDVLMQQRYWNNEKSGFKYMTIKYEKGRFNIHKDYLDWKIVGNIFIDERK